MTIDVALIFRAAGVPRTVAEINRINQTVKEIQASNQEATRLAAALAQAYDLTASEVDQVTRALNRAENEARDLGGASSILQGIFQGVGQQLSSLAFNALSQGAQSAREFVETSIRVNDELIATRNSLDLLLGGAQPASDAIDFLRDVSNRTGQSLTALQRSYQGVTAAARSTTIEQEQINVLFEETARVSGILGLTADRTGLAFQALQQIISKGRVSQEELRQQLGEQLPVALGAFADGMGVSVEEVNALVEAGVSAEVFVDAFTKGLQNIQGEVDPTIQALGQLDNIILQFQQNVGASIQPLRDALVQTSTEVLNTAISSSEALDILTGGSERLAQTLRENPELAQRLGEAFAEAADQVAQLLADGLTELAQWLEENPQAIEAAANNIVEFTRAAASLTVTITQTLGTLGEINEILSIFQVDVFEAIRGFNLLVDGIRSLNQVANESGPVGDFIQGLLDPIGEAVEGMNLLRNAFERVLEQIGLISAQGIDDTLINADSTQGAINAVSDGIQGIQEAASQPIDIDIPSVEDQADRIANQFEQAARRSQTAQQEAVAAIQTSYANQVISASERDAQIAAAEQAGQRERIRLAENGAELLSQLTGSNPEEVEELEDTINGIRARAGRELVALARSQAGERRRIEQEEAEQAEELARQRVANARAEGEAIREAREGQARQQEEDFADSQRTSQEQFEENQRQAKANFEDDQRTQQETFEARQEAKQDAFNRRQEERADVFNQRERDKQEAFNNDQNQRRQEANANFNALEEEVNARLELAQAETREERQRIQERLDAAEEEAELRRDIEQDVLRESGQILANADTELSPLEQARADFEAQLQAEAQQFELAQQQDKAAFEETQQIAKEEFEASLQTAERNFEESQRIAKADFEAEQRQLDLDNDNARRELERAFKEEQRRLDLETAQDIENLLAQARATPQPRAKGGPVTPGNSYLVGEQGPELIFANRAGYVATARETANMMRMQNSPGFMFSQNQRGVETRLDRLIEGVEGQPLIAPATINLGSNASPSDAMEAALTHQRQLIRSRRF